MNGSNAAEAMKQSRHFLDNVLSSFTAADGDFRPAPDMMTVAQQIRHIAMTSEWFYAGGLDDKWDLDFEAFTKANAAPVSFGDAMKQLDATTGRITAKLNGMSAAQLAEPMQDNPILGAKPRLTVLAADTDHMAHHRGVLTVYLRLLNRVPKMVYAN